MAAIESRIGDSASAVNDKLLDIQQKQQVPWIEEVCYYVMGYIMNYVIHVFHECSTIAIKVAMATIC